MWSSPLTKTAIVGGVFVLGAATWMESRIQHTFKKQDYYQEALAMLHRYQPASEFLGHPIYGGRVSLGDQSKFKVELVKAKLSIPLKGSQGRGVLHVLASRENVGDRWNIDLLDLEVLQSKQRWTFYDRSLTSMDTQLSQLSETHTEFK